MSPKEAKKTLELLAQGVDPETGEVLAHDSVLHSPEVIRALFLGARALDAPSQKSVPPTSAPPQAGKPWSREEDERLVAEFDAGAPINKLAELHGRSKGGIASRLVRLGKIDERSKVNAGEPQVHNPPNGFTSSHPKDAA